LCLFSGCICLGEPQSRGVWSTWSTARVGRCSDGPWVAPTGCATLGLVTLSTHLGCLDVAVPVPRLDDGVVVEGRDLKLQVG
jgi:hypothetical protein